MNSERQQLELQKDLEIKIELQKAHDMAIRMEKERIDRLERKAQANRIVLERDNELLNKKDYNINKKK